MTCISIPIDILIGSFLIALLLLFWYRIRWLIRKRNEYYQKLFIYLFENTVITNDFDFKPYILPNFYIMLFKVWNWNVKKLFPVLDGVYIPIEM
jgi:hypothetical protein